MMKSFVLLAVQGVLLGQSAATTNYKPSVAGVANGMSVESRLLEIASVTQYRGVDASGSTNSSGALQRAADELCAGGPKLRKLYFPAGTYNLGTVAGATGFSVGCPIDIYGDGEGSVILSQYDAITLQAGLASGSKVHDLKFLPVTCPATITRWDSSNVFLAPYPATTPGYAVKSDCSGYQPTNNDQAYGFTGTVTDYAGPKIVSTGNDHVEIYNITGKLVSIKIAGGSFNSVHHLNIWGGRDFSDITGGGGYGTILFTFPGGTDNSADSNKIEYSSNAAITFIAQQSPSAKGNNIGKVGESSIKTYQGTIGGLDARSYGAVISGNVVSTAFFDCFDVQQDGATAASNGFTLVTGNSGSGCARTGLIAQGARYLISGNTFKDNGLSGMILNVDNSTITSGSVTNSSLRTDAPGQLAHQVIVSGNNNTVGDLAITSYSRTLDVSLYNLYVAGQGNKLHSIDATDGVVRSFSGSGLDDMTVGGAPSGSTSNLAFDILPDGSGPPNTFKWRLNGGAYTTSVAMTGSPQLLSNGVYVQFGSTTGHSGSEVWLATADLGNNRVFIAAGQTSSMLNRDNKLNASATNTITGMNGDPVALNLQGSDPATNNTQIVFSGKNSGTKELIVGNASCENDTSQHFGVYDPLHGACMWSMDRFGNITTWPGMFEVPIPDTVNNPGGIGPALIMRNPSGSTGDSSAIDFSTGTATDGTEKRVRILSTVVAGGQGKLQIFTKTGGSAAFSGTPDFDSSNAGITALSGDVIATGTGSVAAALASTGVGAGTYTSVTVDAKGRVTAGTNPSGFSGTKTRTVCATIAGGIPSGCSYVTETYVNGLLQ